jgi:Uncharacterized alpha/beta hydrolase domain (DUF2235)
LGQVGALGNPLIFGGVSPQNRFHDHTLSSHVKFAYHALAIDEKRRNFEPTLWGQKPGVDGQTLEQRWFAGAHSNVGGGYRRHSLSDLALAWLKGRAVAAGLVVNDLRLEAPPGLEPVEPSRKALYRLIPTFHRPIGADLLDSDGRPLLTRQSIDESVLQRRREDPTYRPPELEKYLRAHPEWLG